jgi:hypothetical protein
LSGYVIGHRKHDKGGGTDGRYDDGFLQAQKIKNDEYGTSGQDALQDVMLPI